MKHCKNSWLNKFALRKANTTLIKGGIISYPTEAVFGLGCDPMNAEAIQHLLTLKNRPQSKGLILVAASFEQLEPYIQDLSPPLFNKVMKTWPGPVNWLLPANAAAPQYLRGSHRLQAVRVSQNPTIQALCREFGGAIVSTSANYSNRPPARTALQVRICFKKNVDFVINGSVGQQQQPCEIRNGLNDKILRSATG